MILWEDAYENECKLNKCDECVMKDFRNATKYFNYNKLKRLSELMYFLLTEEQRIKIINTCSEL